MKQPWAACTNIRSHRFKYFWTTQLDKKARRRSKLYRKAAKSGLTEDWQQYRALDKEIKRAARRSKTACFQKFVLSIAQQGASKATHILSRIVKGRKRRSGTRRSLGRKLYPLVYTAFVHNVSYDAERPEPCCLAKKFLATDKLSSYIRQALAKAPAGKATGGDSIFVEMFKADPELGSEVLTKIWEKAG